MAFYSGKDQFQRGIMAITLFPFVGVYLYFYGTGSKLWLLILLFLIALVAPNIIKFLCLLYKQGANEKKYVYTVIGSLLVGLCIGLLPKHFFYGQSYLTAALFIWCFYLSAFYSGKTYLNNIDLAESTGFFNKRDET